MPIKVTYNYCNNITICLDAFESKLDWLVYIVCLSSAAKALDLSWQIN